MNPSGTLCGYEAAAEAAAAFQINHTWVMQRENRPIWSYRYLAGKIITILLILMFSAAAHGASFDCEKARSKVEHLVCDTPLLSRLDSKLGEDYKLDLNKADEKQRGQLVAEQKHWLKFMRNLCDDKACLKYAYWSRQATLENYFRQRSPLYKKAADKADAIKKILSSAPLYELRYSPNGPLCSRIFDALKQKKDIHFIDPIVQTQSYEDPALDPWKKNCRTAPPFNSSYQCDRNIKPADANDLLEGCDVGYGLPPFKLYKLPPVDASSDYRYFFYSDEAFGPMNRSWRKPLLGGGFAGFQQINLSTCSAARGNHWGRGGKLLSSWGAVFADAGQGGQDGKNYNSIIEYKKKDYFLILHKAHGSYWLNIQPTVFTGKVCNWSPVKQ